jgi:hypothetical protein
MPQTFQSNSQHFPAEAILNRLDPAKPWKGRWEDFRYSDQEALLREWQERTPFNLNLHVAGRSAEGRALWTLSFGEGPTRVLIWARQHGDECDCTAALCMALHELFFSKDDPVVELIRRECTLLVLPMVNPDGVQRYTRQCAIGIDLNRDAVAQVTPEGRTLAGLRDSFDPELCFNLHDMTPRKATPDGDLVAIAYQAGPFEERDIDNEVRLKAKAVIGAMHTAVLPFVPRNVARYTADYMHRAFGDSMMRWGVGSILIESGGWPQDKGGQDFVRRMHALSILAGLHAIARGVHKTLDGSVYETLPFDSATHHFDCLVRNAIVIDGTIPQRCRMDVGIDSDTNTTRDDDARQFRSVIKNVGDMEDRKGKLEVDASGMALIPGLAAVAPGVRLGKEPLAAETALPLLRAGITTLAASFGPFDSTRERLNFLAEIQRTQPPINIVALEAVSSLDEVLGRHALTEFAAFSVPGLRIAAIDLLEFIEHCNPMVPRDREDPPPTGFLALNLVFRGGASPRHTALHLNLGQLNPRDERKAPRAELYQLRLLADRFLAGRDQIKYSVTGSTRILEPFPITDYPVGLGNLTPPENLLGQILQPCGRGIEGLMALTSLLAREKPRILGPNVPSSIRLDARPDIIGVPLAQVEGKASQDISPSFVTLNGEVVIDQAKGIERPGRGFWHLA